MCGIAIPRLGEEVPPYVWHGLWGERRSPGVCVASGSTFKSALRPVIGAVLVALDRMEMRCLVGGSVASGMYGAPRQTNDLELLVDFSGMDLEEFCWQMELEFVLDRNCMAAGVTIARPFNALHRAGVFQFAVASAEDSVSSKKVWFRCGGEVSERQWHDIRGVPPTQRRKLYADYLVEWVGNLGAGSVDAGACRCGIGPGKFTVFHLHRLPGTI